MSRLFLFELHTKSGYSLMKSSPAKQTLSEEDVNHVIRMAWEDRTTFDEIRKRFNLTPGEVIKLMRKEMKPSSFKMWRERTTGRKTKHKEKSEHTKKNPNPKDVISKDEDSDLE